MLKRLSLLIISGLILTTSTLVNANPAENKLSLSIFSELKQKRSSFPTQSKFETDEEYQQKVNAVSVSAQPLRLELPPSKGEYNLENQQLNITLKTSSAQITSSAKEDEKLTERSLYNMESSYSSYSDMLDYRTDSQTVSEDIMTCVNGFGARYQYLHSKRKSTEYLINTLNIDVDNKIVLDLSPQEAKKYFKSDETSLNDRLQVRINLDPVAPYYTNYASYSSGDCPNSDYMKYIANTFGVTTSYSNIHLIHADVSYIEVFDKVTGKTLYSISPTKNNETQLSRNEN